MKAGFALFAAAAVAASSLAGIAHGSQIDLSGATVSQSSHLNATSYPDSAAINGNFNDFTHSINNGTDPSPILTIALAGDTQIGDIDIHNRADCCGYRLSDIQIKVYNSSNVVVADSGILNPGNALGFGTTETPGNATTLGPYDLRFDLNGPVTGNKITIQRFTDTSENGVLSVGEVVAFTTSVPEPASLSLLSLGGLGLLSRRRRQA